MSDTRWSCRIDGVNYHELHQAALGALEEFMSPMPVEEALWERVEIQVTGTVQDMRGTVVQYTADASVTIYD